MSDFRFPSLTQRTMIVGRTGSGKSQLGMWVLGNAPFDKQPYIIVDYKRDDLINSIAHIRQIGLNEKIPTQPGLYVLQPLPSQQEQVEKWLWKVWEKENTGLFLDEGYALPDGGAITAILTQGRSKRIPVIALSQRPKWLSRFFFSEANQFVVFHLNDVEDRKSVNRFIPGMGDFRLPEYHSYWYDIDKDNLFHMQPVPDADTIAEQMEQRLKPKRKFF